MNNYRNGEGGAKFLLGIVLGGVIGGISALMLSPKSGKENREDLNRWVRDNMNKARSAANDFYQDAKNEINDKLAEVKDKMDRNRYVKLVDAVVKDMEADGELDDETREQVRRRLVTDWQRLKNRFT